MISTIRRRISLNRTQETGFGLIELIVAMGLFSILATLIVLTFAAFTRTMTEDRAATTNTNLASVAMDELTRVIRAATSIPVPNTATDLPAFEFANKEKIVLYAYIDTGSATPAPMRVQFEIIQSGTQSRYLVETRWAAFPKSGYPTYWDFYRTDDTVTNGVKHLGNYISKRTIAQKIVTPASGQPFLFNYQSIGTDLLPDDMVIPTGSGGITAANLPKIAVVEVTVTVQSDITGRALPVTMTNQVGIPNLGISRLALS